MIRRLLAGDDTGFEGEQFSLAPGARLRYEPVRAEVPLLIGTWGVRVAAYAGEVASEVKIGGTANPDLVPVMRSRIGNDGVRIVVGAVTVVDEDAEAARRRAREEAALYFPVVAGLDPTLDVPPAWSRRCAAWSTPESEAAAGRLIPDALSTSSRSRALPKTSRDRPRRSTTREPHGRVRNAARPDARRGIELLAERVVPGLRP